jgi:hypothetical protein
MSLHLDLLNQARHLARMDPRRPRQTNLRRAVSAAYYALFHYLIDQACRNALGTQQAQVAYRQVIARGLEHGGMKSACRSFAGGQLPLVVRRGLPAGFVVPDELRNVAQAFVDLQEQRHLADYDLSWNLTRAQALDLVQQADQARIQFEHWDDRDLKKFFLTCLMTWKVLAQRT